MNACIGYCNTNRAFKMSKEMYILIKIHENSAEKLIQHMVYK